MGDDVVEATPGLVDFVDVALNQTEIAKREITDHLLAGRDRFGGEINSQELACGKFPRHRDEVVAVAATEFEDAAMLHGRGFETKESGQDGEAVGMRLRVRVTGIQDDIVV